MRTINCGMWDLVPRSGIEPRPSALGMQSLSHWTFPCASVGKESTCNAGDLGLIPGLGRSPGEGKGYQLQYSGLENSMDCVVRGVAKSRTQVSDFHFRCSHWTTREVSRPGLLFTASSRGSRLSPVLSTKPTARCQSHSHILSFHYRTPSTNRYSLCYQLSPKLCSLKQRK